MKLSVLALALFSSIATHAMADDLEKINQKKEIVIGVRDSSPPFGYFDKAKGSVSGYDVEFAMYVANKLGAKPIFKTVDPADRIAALKEGRVDVLFATFGKNREREKEVDFSVGYFVGTQKMVAKKGRFQDLTQLDKLTVCVPKGTTNAKYLQDVSTTVQVKLFEDYAEVFTALKEGKCEYASGPEATMLGNLAKMSLPARNDFEVSDVPIASDVYGAGIRKGQKALQQAINNALADAEKTGEAARIFEHWFGGTSAVQLNRNFKISL
ncbi:transporter substrate-binding domain-containing protein [Chitinimonas sp.]|uniref:transporter substrate-binding domain-containing protein n=1 Tax=Chitinimonas sp. TaxID=1934313 RepID=UPI0035AFC618